MNNWKCCSCCKRPLDPIEDFYSKTSTYCKVCEREKKRLKYHTDANDRKKKLESNQRWRENNPEKWQIINRKNALRYAHRNTFNGKKANYQL